MAERTNLGTRKSDKTRKTNKSRRFEEDGGLERHLTKLKIETPLQRWSYRVILALSVFY